MEFVYLGLFSRIFNWVLDKIFEPVFKFIANLLSTVFNWVFNKILAPILMPILQEALEFFIDLFLDIFSVFIYGIFAGFLKLIDYFQIAFDVFIGLEDVTYVQPGGVAMQGPLLDVLMEQDSIKIVFWVITAGALGIAFLLTIFATIQSTFDLDYENKRPVSKVLTAMMKTFIRFFTVPVIVVFILKLSSVILRGATNALTLGNDETTLGRIIFMIASLDAAKSKSFNLSSASANTVIGANDSIRRRFYYVNGGMDYTSINDVEKYFDLTKFDYLIGFIAAIFLFFTIGICLIIFIQRIFEMILLYIVSPYFVSTMPLDDGEKFSKWQEMFIGKCFTGFGSAIGMRLYLMICPIIMGNQLTFGTAANPSSPEMDYLMKLFFLAGGAWAVYKSGSMITSLISYQAGTTEASTAAMAGGVLFSHTVGKAIGAGKSLVGRGENAIKRKLDSSGKDQAFKGDKKLQGAINGMDKAGGVKHPAAGGMKAPAAAGKRQIPPPPNRPLPPVPNKAGKRQIPAPPNYPPPKPPVQAGKRQIPAPPNYPPPAPPKKNQNRPLPPIPGQVPSGRRNSIAGGEKLQIQTSVSLNTLASRRASWSAGSGASLGGLTSASFEKGSLAADFGGTGTGRFKGESLSISSTRADERQVLSVSINTARAAGVMGSVTASVSATVPHHQNAGTISVPTSAGVVPTGNHGSIASSVSSASTVSASSTVSAGTQNASFKSRVPNGKIQAARSSSSGQFTGGKG